MMRYFAQIVMDVAVAVDTTYRWYALGRDTTQTITSPACEDVTLVIQT